MSATVQKHDRQKERESGREKKRSEQQVKKRKAADEVLMGEKVGR